MYYFLKIYIILKMAENYQGWPGRAIINKKFFFKEAVGIAHKYFQRNIIALKNELFS